MPKSEISAEELERVNALLPWYANGSLNQSDTEWLETWLLAHRSDVPEVYAELAWLKQTATQWQSAVVLPDSEKGLDTVLSRIHLEKSALAQLRRGNEHFEKGNGWSRIKVWLMNPVFGMAMAALFLVQTGVVTILLNRSPAVIDKVDPITQSQSLTPLSGASVSVPANATALQITFVPSAKESEIRQVLSEANAQIIAGPSALGVYTIAVNAVDGDKTLKLLQSKSKIIESVSRP